MRAHRWLSLGGFLLCPLPPLQLLIFCTEKYIVSISRNTGQISPCLFLSPSRGKNLPKCESLASVLAYVLWLPCRYWITEFWIMFKMDTSLASTMEEFQELVKANGEELHRRLIDTTQMWVPCLWKPPPSCNTTQAAQQASVSCCDLCCVPLWPKKPSGRFSGFTKEKSLPCIRKAEKSLVIMLYVASIWEQEKKPQWKRNQVARHWLKFIQIPRNWKCSD